MACRLRVDAVGRGAVPGRERRNGPSSIRSAGPRSRRRCRSTRRSRSGRFDNGLRYYIRVNKQPANRIELRLAVNAGSILEDDDQQGLAHFVEHMAFNGTKNFPKDAVPKFFESIGMRFGPSLNAFTSFDQTVYMQTIPADKPDVVQKAFQVLEDWAHNLSFEPAEIDKERGVIVEEWRLGRGAGARMQDKQWPILLKGSRYAERNPIGKKEIIETFKHDRLKKFYTDWYRPDLMAVVVVGDFDKTAIEGLVKTHFGAPAEDRGAAPAADLQGAGASDDAVRARHRQGSPGHLRRGHQEIPRTRPDDARRVSADLRRAAVHVDVRPPDERDRPEGRPAVPRRRRHDRAGRHRQDRRDTTQRLGEGDRRRTRPRGRADRVGAGAEVRVHADRIRSAEARDAPVLRATVHGAREAGVVDARGRIRPQLHRPGDHPGHRVPSTPRASGSCRRSRSTRSTRWRRSSRVPPTAW